MPSPHLIGQPPASTPGMLRIVRAHRSALPDDLLRDASRRLGIIALLGSGLWVVASVFDYVERGVEYVERGVEGEAASSALQGADAIAIASAVVSLALFLYTRRSSRGPGFILDLGLVFLIYTCFALGVVQHWDKVPEAAAPSWIGVVLLVFAALVPSTPRKTLLTGLIAASMNPLGMAVARSRDVDVWDGSVWTMFLRHYPDYLLVGVAVVISYVVNRLGQQVAKERELGSYKVGELLGKGGMGEVYRATHRMLARPAAIKLIRPEIIGGGISAAGELAVKRFRREAEAAANLRSPHTVDLYDFGVTEDQTFYFVMELLEGMSLETLAKQYGPVPANRVIHILCQVCDSLQEAHERGLVHRDIKPANIHIGRLGMSHDWVKVLDFGLVKSVRGPSSDSSLATGMGAVPGTPDYMAPEMTLGEEVDGRADLYALGCVGYYLLTGKLIFEATSVFHAIARHLNDAPVPPSRHPGVSVPPALEQLVLTCVAKDPKQRPQSAAELARLLAAIDVEPWGEAQAAEWWMAHRPS